jgi:hypothetical protein
MNRRIDRCLRLGVGALPGIATAVCLALGLPPTQWFVVVGASGGVVCLAVLFGVCRAAVSRRTRAARAEGRPWWLAVLAGGLPDQYALKWAEQMHDQLCERSGLGWNIVTRAPLAWLGDWWAHWRERRYGGDVLLLVTRLDLALQTPGRTDRLPGRFAVLHAVGMSRALACRPVQQVRALALARQLLATRTPKLAAARDRARELLTTRHEAHVITRALRHKPGPTDTPAHRRRAALRDAMHRLVDELRAELRAFVDGERNPDGR